MKTPKQIWYPAIASIATLLYFSPIPKLVFAQTTPQDIIQAQEVRLLPGKLDNIPVFNSNSPEGVTSLRTTIASR